MTKEQYDNYTGELYCRTCKRNVPKIHMYYKKVYQNGDVTRCNVCDWLKRHDGIPQIDGFNEQEILTALYFFIYEESIYINDLSQKLEISLDDAINLYRKLNLKGKKCIIKANCEYCGKEIEKPLSVYLLNQDLYCSRECYWNDKPNKTPHGENNPSYIRIKTECTNCGKELKIIPYNYNEKNSFGDNHNFCCQKCYWEYRSKYYRGEKSHMTGYKFSEDQLEKMRIRALKNSRNSKRFDSGAQLQVNDMLESENINYEREQIIKYYAVDNYLPDHNLIIEVMGDYWHGNPLRYNENKYCLNDIQQKTIVKDKQKKSYILNHNDIRILYLWETDINKNPELCKKLILEYIKNKGKLENYHSFNWCLKNGSLFLCDDLIIPYQDMKSDDYKHLIKKKVG